jgi:hypothetical protein
MRSGALHTNTTGPVLRHEAWTDGDIGEHKQGKRELGNLQSEGNPVERCKRILRSVQTIGCLISSNQLSQIMTMNSGIDGRKNF